MGDAVHGNTRRIRPGNRKDFGVAAELLAAALADDPATLWLHPKESTRRIRLARSFRSSLDDSRDCSDGVDLALDGTGAIVGVAVWLATFHILPRATVGRQLGALRTYGSHAAQARAGAQATYAAGVQEQHWHLLALGVSAKARGRGHGQDLVAAGMYRAAADGVPVHLETTNPNNLSFYERLGFDTTAVIDLPGGGPCRWLMRQVPQPISSPVRGRRSRST
ncbi:GNAT family N-acetyltransferase [Nocardia salmonicida]|uniref:GNAT family N-acetyltransferase n=1 Tax=Nocardia salmonicida TaxID=53431 RepID=UPI002E2DC520|nr:GNAT family N-acetyltransferase [Nocardia salmonicida]